MANDKQVGGEPLLHASIFFFKWLCQSRDSREKWFDPCADDKYLLAPDKEPD